MTISDLHYKLKEKGIDENQYFLHGLFGSTDDNDKIGLTIRQGQNGLEYETFYKERGEKHSLRIFTTEKEAWNTLIKNSLTNKRFTEFKKLLDYQE